MDSKSNKYENEFKLELYELSKLPDFIRINEDKYRDFIDYD